MSHAIDTKATAVVAQDSVRAPAVNVKGPPPKTMDPVRYAGNGSVAGRKGWKSVVARFLQLRQPVGMEREEAEVALRQAQRILAQPPSYQPEEWMLLATLVGEADRAIRKDLKAGPNLTALLEEVIGDFREATRDFTDPAFLRGSSRPAPQQGPFLRQRLMTATGSAMAGWGGNRS